MKHLSRIHFAVIILILSSLIMHYVYFTNTGNFNSPIIEYEFATTSDDVKNIFMKDNEFRKDIIQGVHDQNIVDYLYMVVYSLLLLFFFARVKEFEKNKLYFFGAVFAILALITDSIENILLFNISELLTTRNNFSSEIDILFIITRIKWFSIAIALLFASFHYIKYNILGKAFAVLSSIPFIFGTIYFLIQNEVFLKLFTSSIMLGFVILIIWVFIPKNDNKAISFYKEIPFKSV